MSTKLQYLLTSLLIAVLVLSGCGGPAANAPVAEEQVVEQAAAEVVEVPAVEEVTGDAFDIQAAADAYLSTIPEGWMSAGSVEAVKEMMAATDVYLIDVREASEYAEGHLPGAVNIPIRTVTQRLENIPSDMPVVVYCASGYRAALTTSALRLLGYDNVKAFPASYKGWVAVGEEVTTDSFAVGTFDVPEIEPALLTAVDEFMSTIPEGYYAVGTVEKMKDAIDAGAFVIDVREPSEYAEGYLPGAVSMPLRSLATFADQIPTDVQVITYCKSGYRAALAAAVLHSMGFENVRAFPPSYLGWVDAGEAVVQ